MSTPTANYGLIKAAEGEQYDVDIPNNNLDSIDTLIRNLNRAKTAQFNMMAARTGSPAGNGINWGWLQADTSRGYSHAGNDFCVIANEGTQGQSNEKGRIRITKEGIYDLFAQYTCTVNPGSLNFAMIIDKAEGGSEKIPMSRPGTYGDWEALVGKTGTILKVGDHISGYQANSAGAVWAMGMTIKWVGTNG